MRSNHFQSCIILSMLSLGLCCFPTFAADANDSSNSSSYVDTLVNADADAIAANEAANQAAKDDSVDVQTKIAKNTYAALKAFNAFILSWLHPDDSKTTTEIAPNVFNYFKYKFENDKLQLASQESLVSGMVPRPNFDLTYTTLLGNVQTDAPEKQASALNYIKYASSLNISHAQPYDPKNLVQGQNETPAQMYLDLYKTTAAIQTYNAYLLSKSYVEYKNGAKLTKAQYDLQNKASDEAWLLSVATETSLGIILRQILLFTSQLYLLSLESLDIQNKQLAATAMTNSLLILGNQYWEVQLHDYAAGRQWPYR